MLSYKIVNIHIVLKRFAVFVLILTFSCQVQAMEIHNTNDTKLNIGFWGQTWFQYVSDYDLNGDGLWNKNLNDFMFRRAYFYIKGTITPNWEFFVHYAADRLGQDAINYNSGKGLGEGLALRDGWIKYNIWENNVILQAGRMYIPFTRNYGTTSTKSLLTLDLNWVQGGYRGGIFYPSNVGRDDAVVVWGNLMQDKLQYRFMTGDGSNNRVINPNDNLRLAGRMSYNFFDSETGWFNSGTYIGKKQVLAFGGGFDTQHNLVMNNALRDYLAWTVDIHYDQPLGKADGLTIQSSFISIDNCPNGISMTWLTTGDDAYITSFETGYYFGHKIQQGYFQPFAHYENIHVKESHNFDTHISGLGINYYLKGQANKMTLEVSSLNQEHKGVSKTDPQDELIITFQFAAGI